MAETRLKIAVFIDFDNIEIGVKTTLGQHFDVGAVLEAIKERGEVVTKIAYGDWTRAGDYSRSLTQHAIHMVQRNLTPGGDKNGADINLALDALEMAFTHSHINAFVIVGGDSDFMALVEKLKQYDRKVFVVGGRAFTSIILQKNCTEFIAYENLVNLVGVAPPKAGGRGGKRAEAPVSQAVTLVRRALKVLSDREVSPQLGVLKSTLLQLDSTFSEREYGASTFRDFVQKLARAGYVTLKGTDRNIYVELREGTDGGSGGGSASLPAPGGGKDGDPVVGDGEATGVGVIGVDGEQPLTLGGEVGSGHVDAGGLAAPSTNGAGGGSHGSASASTSASGMASHDVGVSEGVSASPAIGAPGSSPQAEGARFITEVFQRPGIVSRWPLYLRQVKQILRGVDESFDERRYGFQGLVEALRYCQREGLFRLDRDRQGVLRVYPGPALARVATSPGSPVTDVVAHTPHAARGGDEDGATKHHDDRHNRNQRHERGERGERGDRGPAAGDLFGESSDAASATEAGDADAFATAAAAFGALTGAATAGAAASAGAAEDAANGDTDAREDAEAEGPLALTAGGVEASGAAATENAASPTRASRRRRPGAIAAKSTAKKTAATPKPRGAKSSRPRKAAKESKS